MLMQEQLHLFADFSLAKAKNSLPKTSDITVPKKIFLRLICPKYKSGRVRGVFYYGGFGTEHWLSHSATDVNGWIIEGE